MSELQDQIGSIKIESVGFIPQILQSQSEFIQLENQNLEVDLNERKIKSEQLDNKIAIKLEYQFQEHNKNNNKKIEIEIPEVRNYRDQKIYFYSVLLQLTSDIEVRLQRKDYIIRQVQFLEILQSKQQTKPVISQIGKIILDVKSKEQVITAYEQSNQNDVDLNKLTLKDMELKQLLCLNINQIFDLQEMNKYQTLKEAIFNFQIDLY